MQALDFISLHPQLSPHTSSHHPVSCDMEPITINNAVMAGGQVGMIMGPHKGGYLPKALHCMNRTPFLSADKDDELGGAGLVVTCWIAPICPSWPKVDPYLS